MSTHTSTSPQWDTEVLDYARANQVEQYLLPLWNMVNEVFPHNQRVRVYLNQDPELRDVQNIAFDVEAIPFDVTDVQTYVKKYNEWVDKVFALCPTIVVHHFVLLIGESPNGSA